MFLLALVGPQFVNWDDQRTAIEAELSRIFDVDVVIRGSLDVEFLPRPRVEFNDIVIGSPFAPIVRSERAGGRVELFPLLTGEVKIDDFILIKPVIHLRLDQKHGITFKGQPSLLKLSSPERIAIDRFFVENGEIRIENRLTSTTHVLRKINANAHFSSLNGPFLLDGSTKILGKPYQFRIQGGIWAGEELPLKVELDMNEVAIRAQLSGKFSPADSGNLFEGELTIEKSSADLSESLPAVNTAGGVPEWSIRSPLALSADSLAMSDMIWEYEDAQDTPVRLQGKATWLIGSQASFRAVLSAEHLDVDNYFSSADTAWRGWTEELVSRIDAFVLAGVKSEIEFSARSLRLRDANLRDVSIRLTRENENWRADYISLDLPGSSQFRFAGDVYSGRKSTFSGRFSLKSERPKSLAHWALGDEASMWPISNTILNVRGHLLPLGDALRVDGLIATYGSRRFRGTVDVSSASLHESPSVSISGSVPTLSVDDPFVEWLFRPERFHSESTGIDLNLQVSQFIIPELGSFAMNVSARQLEEGWYLDQFRLTSAELGTFSVKGRLGLQKQTTTSLNYTVESQAPVAVIRGIFEASEASEAKDLLPIAADRSSGDRWLSILTGLEQRAEEFTPLSFSGKLTSQFVTANNSDIPSSGNSLAGTAPFRSVISLTGQVGSSTLNLWARSYTPDDRLRPVSLDVDVNLIGRNARFLLKQFLNSEVEIDGPGKVALRLSSPQGKTGNLQLEGEFGEIAVEGDFRLLLSEDGEFFSPDWLAKKWLRGTVRVTGIETVPELRPVFRHAGFASGNAIRINADLIGELYNWNFGAIRVSDARTTVLGSMVIDPDRKSVNGDVNLPVIQLDPLNSYVTSDQNHALLYFPWTWSAAAFDKPPGDGWTTQLNVRARKIVLDPEIILRNVTWNMGNARRSLSLENFRAQLFDGAVFGEIHGRFTEPKWEVRGDLGFSELPLSVTLGEPNQQISVNGEMSGRARFQTQALSLAGLVSAARGEGHVDLSDVRVVGLGEDMLPALVRLHDSRALNTHEELDREFIRRLSWQREQIPQARSELLIQHGVLRFDVTSEETDSPLGVKGEIDFTNGIFDSNWVISGEPDPELDLEAEYSVRYSGPVGSLQRSVDTSSLMSFFNVRLFEKNVEELENLEIGPPDQKASGAQLLNRFLFQGQEVLANLASRSIQ